MKAQEQKIISLVAIAVIALAVIVHYGRSNNNASIETSSTKEMLTSNDQSVLNAPKIDNIIETSSPLKNGYSVVFYPLSQSPTYSQLDADCKEYSVADTDARIVDKNDRIVVPSLLSSLTKATGEPPNCYSVIKIFSVPQNGDTIYLERDEVSPTEMPATKILYRFNLKNISFTELTVSPFNFASSVEPYKIMADGKRIITWNDNHTIELLNLEDDSLQELYTAPEGQWLVSKIGWGMGPLYDYDVVVNINSVTFGIYSEAKTKDNLILNKEDAADHDIYPQFIKTVTIQIP